MSLLDHHDEEQEIIILQFFIGNELVEDRLGGIDDLFDGCIVALEFEEIDHCHDEILWAYFTKVDMIGQYAPDLRAIDLLLNKIQILREELD